MKLKSRFVSLALATLLAAPPVLAAKSDPVATVNGKTITEESLETYAKLRGPSPGQGQPDRNALVNEMVTRELIYQDAVGKGLDKNPELKRQIELQREEMVINAALRRVAEATPVTEADLRKEYDQTVAATKMQEYKARHILTETEADAKAVIAELDKGADFTELAKKRSVGPSAQDGGDLGWFTPANMVPPFAQAVEKMKKGTYTKQPVQTQFGWHVIKLEDTRPLTPPAFEEVKDQLDAMVKSKRVREYVDALRAKAKVTTK